MRRNNHLCRWLPRSLAVAVSCILLVSAESSQGQQAGLVVRNDPNEALTASVDKSSLINQMKAIAATGTTPVPARLFIKRQNLHVKDPDATYTGEEDLVVPTSESTASPDTDTFRGHNAPKTTKATTHTHDAPAPLVPTETTPSEDTEIYSEGEIIETATRKTKTKATTTPTTTTRTYLDEGTAEPTVPPTVNKPMHNRPGGSTPTPQPPLHYEPGGEGEPEPEGESCDEEPFTVYVTITVTPTPSDDAPTATPGDSGEECVDGCYNVPTATPDGFEDGCIDGCFTSTDEELVPTPAPAPVEEGDDEYYSSELDEDWVSSEIIDMSASASASPTGGEFADPGDAALSRFNTIPVAVSVLICALTSLVSCFIFTGP